MQGTALRLIKDLSTEERLTLVNEWRRVPRLLEHRSEQEILDQYTVILLEHVVNRARGIVFRGPRLL